MYIYVPSANNIYQINSCSNLDSEAEINSLRPMMTELMRTYAHLTRDNTNLDFLSLKQPQVVKDHLTT